jgi:hypothetical protein
MKTSCVSSILLTLPLAVTLLAAGCGTTVNTVERAEPVGRRDMLPDKRIITDTGLNRRVRVLGVNQTTGPGGFLKVQVEVLNTTGSLETFNYRWEWFDENGNIIEVPSSASLSKQIEGKESVFLVGVAPNETAKDFRLKLIENLR